MKSHGPLWLSNVRNHLVPNQASTQLTPIMLYVTCAIPFVDQYALLARRELYSATIDG
jgi:hypothetical protein